MGDLYSLGAKPDGIDANQALLDHARQNLPFPCTLTKADFNAPHSRPNGQYDLIWSSFTMAYAIDPVKNLTRWRNSLLPGGKMALIEMSGLLDHDPMSDEDRAAIRAFQTQNNLYDFRAGASLVDWMQSAGLRVEPATELRDQELTFQGPAETDVLTAWRQRLNRMPGLISAAPPGFADRFLETLASPRHRTLCTVHCVIGHLAA